jgi:hypothetical protein
LTFSFALFACLSACGQSQREPLRAVVLEVGAKPGAPAGLSHLLQSAEFQVESIAPQDSLKLQGVALLALGSFVSAEPGYAEFIHRHRDAIRRFVRDGGVLLQMSQSPEHESYFDVLSGDHRAGRQPGTWMQSFVRDQDHPLVHDLPRSNHGGMQSIELPMFDGHKPSRHPLAIIPGSRQILMADRRGQSTTLFEAQVDSGRIVLTSFWFDRSVGAHGEALGAPALADAARTFFHNLHGYVERLRAHRLPAVRKFEFAPTPEPLPFVPGSWTLVVLPDTQGYSRSRPEIFEAQTRWIAASVRERNIRYVVHLGDLTNNNEPQQWQAAKVAMSTLDGVVGYALCTGNHDLGPGGHSGNRDTLFDTYFPLAQFELQGNVLTSLGSSTNAIHGFEAGGESWIILSLEWGPRDATLVWADKKLDEFAASRVIVVTHAYMNDGDIRLRRESTMAEEGNPHDYDTAKLPGGTNDGEEIWQKLISKHPNIDFVLSGHVLGDGFARLSSQHANGHVVHQILSNYQHYENDGNGYLRLMEFLPDGKTVQIKSYSPYTDQYFTDWENQFVLELSERAPSARR